MEKLIKLSNSLNFYDTENNKINFVGPLCRLNILVGVNNSGKSRFMRNIFSSAENALYSLKDDFDRITLKNNIESTLRRLGSTTYGPNFLTNPDFEKFKNTLILYLIPKKYYI